MKKVLVGAIIALASVLIYKSCADDNKQKTILEENSMLIQQELKNVSKLAMTLQQKLIQQINYGITK